MTPQDLEQLKEDYVKDGQINVPLEKVQEQLEIFTKGIPHIKLVRPCTKGDGITNISTEIYDDLTYEFEEALENNRLMKFVPASGAASRMFHKLQSVLAKMGDVYRDKLEEGATAGDEECKAVLEFIDNIDKFAFYPELVGIMSDKGLDINSFLDKGYYNEILNYTLNPEGLDYANQPKGCIIFHSYHGKTRTAFEEHLEEAVNYTRIGDSPAKVHFTISPEYSELINTIMRPAIKRYELRGIKIDVSYSHQKSSTDTIAVDHDNKPFKDDDGHLIFRPAGHGALIENLYEVNGDIVFIKNIDNVVPERLRGTTYLYKRILAGYLLRMQSKIFTYLRAIDAGQISLPTINSIKEFAQSELSIQFDESFEKPSLDEKLRILKEKLNRPIRVCGMVKNEGHLGGGPFWVEAQDGTVSLQIVEKTQIDVNNDEQRKILEASTHFNPVDLVCGIRNYKGNRFYLPDYRNLDSGLITIKSKDGRELKALELPGLWNGGMANWITIFIEVPKITFTPVKEINDLLKEEHQPGV